MQSLALDHLEDDRELTDLCQFAADLCGTQAAFVSLADGAKQHILARAGVPAHDISRQGDLCALALLQPGTRVIPDTNAHPEYSRLCPDAFAAGIRFYAGAGVMNEDGALLGAFCVIDTQPRSAGLTEMQRKGLEILAMTAGQRLALRRENTAAMPALRHSEERPHLMAHSIPNIVWSADGEGNIDFFNERWYDFVGAKQNDEGSWDRFFHPDDRKQAMKKWRDSFVAGHHMNDEWRVRSADGDYRWMLVKSVPVKGEDGLIQRWYGTITDIDATRKHSESRDLLARELSHRIKNIFSVISGLVNLRSRGKPEVKDFANDLNETILALGKAQDFVRPFGEESEANLVALVKSLIAPFSQRTGSTVVIAGDDVVFEAGAATPLALIFHEMATNAAKYGALSSDQGAIRIEIRKKREDVEITWSESGGPKVTKPAQLGFGSRLVSMSLRNQLGGEIAFDWREAGLHVQMTVPGRELEH